MKCKKCDDMRFEITRKKSYMLLPDGLVGRTLSTIERCLSCNLLTQRKMKEDIISIRNFTKEDIFTTKDGRVYWNDIEAVLMKNEHGGLVIKKNTENNRKKFSPYNDSIKITKYL